MKSFITIREQVLRSMFEWVCMALVVCLVFLPIGVSILSLVLAGCWLLFYWPKQFNDASGKYTIILFVLIYAWLLFGISYSENQETAWFKAQQKSALLAFPVIFGWSKILNTDSIRRILFTLLLSTVVASVLCIGSGVVHLARTGQFDQLNGYSMIILKDMNPYLMGLLSIMAIAVAVNYFFYPVKNRLLYKVSMLASIVLLACFIFLLGNRSIIFCFLVLAFAYSLKGIRSILTRWVFLSTVAIAVLISVLFVPSLNRQVKELFDRTNASSIVLDEDASLGKSWGGKAIREAIWKCGIDVVQANPVTGVGIGDVQDKLQEAYEKRKFYFASRYNRYNAHNQYLQELIGGGIIGLCTWIGCILWPFFYAWRNRNWIYVIFLGGIAILSLTESILEISKGVVYYSFFNSLFAFTKTKNNYHD